jgi:hypothetical protein
VDKTPSDWAMKEALEATSRNWLTLHCIDDVALAFDRIRREAMDEAATIADEHGAIWLGHKIRERMNHAG